MPTKETEKKMSTTPGSHTLRALQDELAVSSTYGTTPDGRNRRKLTREQSKKQTIQRKQLEKTDAKELAIVRVDDESAVKDGFGDVASQKPKRLRGKNVALDNSVVEGSFIFGSSTSKTTTKGVELAPKKSVTWEDQQDDMERALENFLDGEQEDDIADMDEDDDSNFEEDETDEDDDGEEDEENDDNMDNTPLESSTAKNTAINNIQAKPSSAKKMTKRRRTYVQKSSNEASERAEQMKAAAAGHNSSRLMYRLKNFKSYRMALRHGEALGAHARGLHKTAIGRLQEVAASVPIAPQLYSSLGLVYENILMDDAQKKSALSRIHLPTDDNAKETADSSTEELSSLRHRIDIATKAYGSYHVAALLCKKDFTLWLRAGDMALEIAELHSIAFAIFIKGSSSETYSPTDLTNSSEIELHRLEKGKWLLEARDDYLIADNIRPPGITVPAKLAFTQMHLGNYSESLTILTDLKNQAQKCFFKTNQPGRSVITQRSELERSYSAWMLYSDLMLRIGYECTRWNRCIHTNENATFRRWLKKYSRTFDWKERRLQALCLAFEAAAGSASGKDVVLWVKERACKIFQPTPLSDSQVTEGLWFADEYEMVNKPNSNDDEKEVPKTYAEPVEKEPDSPTQMLIDKSIDERKDLVNLINHNEPSSATPSNQSLSLHEERRLLIEKNRRELADFDRETSLINPSRDLQSVTERNLARESMIRKHKEMILKLLGDFQANSLSQTTTPNDEIFPLPMSASYKTVCNIAYQLMKLCLSMELYDGGKLVAEATVKYFRERIVRRSSRLDSFRECQTRLSSVKTSTFNLNTETYDVLDASSEDSENDENYLSDDDAFDNADEEALSSSLPPYHQILYGVSLLGTKSYTFLARKLLSSLDRAPERSSPLSVQDCLDTDLLSSPTWADFYHEMTQPLNKMESFSLASRIMKKLHLEKEWSQNLSASYQRCLTEYEQNQLLVESESYHAMQLKKPEYLTVLLSYLRMEFFRVQSMLDSTHVSGYGLHQNEALDSLYVILSKIYRLKEILLKRPAIDATLDSVAIEAMQIIAEVFDLTASKLKDAFSYDDSLEFIKQIFLLTSWLCQAPIPVSADEATSSIFTVPVEGLPFSRDWQRDAHKALSRLVHNMCVSCSVSALSGWGRNDFHRELLKHRHEPNFFGVTSNGSIIAGVLGIDIEKRLKHLWMDLRERFHTISFDFSESLTSFHKSSWYIDAVMNRSNVPEGQSIDIFGEKYTVRIFLSFAELCLSLEKTSLTKEPDHLIKYALSIILPMTQFCVNQTIWTSEMVVKEKDEGIIDWHQFLPRPIIRNSLLGTSETEGPQPMASTLAKTKFTRPSRLLNQSMEPRRMSKSQGSIDQESPLDTLVEVQIDWLQSEWIKSSKPSLTNDIMTASIDDSMSKMNELDSSLARLKNCTTVVSIQKACLYIAVALLDVAASIHCYNPFLCLHHAAIFASQGSKGGNNDDFFKKPLPPQRQCTTRDAIGILGRADCLRAIHFSDEAMFLCSYVAGVLSLNRRMDGNNNVISSDWKAIGIHMYTCAIAVDTSIYSLMDIDTRKKALDSWELEVQEEINAARKDARDIRKVYSSCLSDHKAMDDSTDDPIFSFKPIPYMVPLPDNSLNHVPASNIFEIPPPLASNYLPPPAVTLPMAQYYLPPSSLTFDSTDDIEIVAL